MAHQTDATADGGSSTEHPAADLDTIVVDPDDVIAAMKRNHRDQDEQRSHVLRVSPPFEGEKGAKPHVSEAHTYYPPEMDPTPIHLSPAAFLVGHSEGSRHPDYHDEWRHPDRGTQKSLFRDEHGARGPGGENRQLTDEEAEQWGEWWSTAVKMWEDRVRHALQQVDEVEITNQYPSTESTTVSVRFESQE